MRIIKHGGDIYSRKNSEKITDFSANINPLGMPESVKQAIISNINCFEAYPDCQCTDLRKAVSSYYKTNEDYFVFGNGAADIIYRIALSLKPHKAVILAPTFSEYEDALKLSGTEICYYNLKEENNFSIKSDIKNYIKEKNPDIIFLCNPNNPTGIPLEKEKAAEIIEICREAGIICVVDECFSDFLEEEEKYTLVPYLKDYKNLIILKAFTKMYAMAGIRLGYMMCSDSEISFKVNNMLQPWSVSTVAQKAGEAAIKEKCFVLQTKKYIAENRKYLIENLNSLNFKTYPSKTNYILFKTDFPDLIKKLEERDILIRSCANYKNLDSTFYRIAVKSETDNKKLISALKNAVNASI